MLRYAFVCWALLGAAGSGRADSWGENLFEQLTCDFGCAPHGALLTHQFRLVNKTQSPLHIANVRVSCGCTSARALQNYIPPGQETIILVQMDTRRFYDTKAVNVFVLFDQPQFDEVRLWVQANSRSDISFTPTKLAFGKVKQGDSRTAQMTVTVVGRQQLQVVGIKSESNYIQPKVEALHSDANSAIFQISADLHPETPAGKWYSDLYLLTNDTSLPRLRVPLTVEIEPGAPLPRPETKPAAPAAPIVALGEIKARTETDRKVIIRSDQPFRIIDIKGADKEINVRPDSADSETSHTLVLTLHPAEPGEFQRVIEVQTDLRHSGNVIFNAQAKVVP